MLGALAPATSLQYNSTEMTLPVLLYDGDCAFCTSCARWLERRVRPAAVVEPWQFAELEQLGVSAERARAAVQWVGADGIVRSGHAAIAATLATAGAPWSALGRFMLLPGVSWIAARAYALIAKNRHSLPGATPACKL